MYECKSYVRRFVQRADFYGRQYLMLFGISTGNPTLNTQTYFNYITYTDELNRGIYNKICYNTCFALINHLFVPYTNRSR